MIHPADDDDYASGDFTYGEHVLDFYETFDTGVIDKSDCTFKNGLNVMYDDEVRSQYTYWAPVC